MKQMLTDQERIQLDQRVAAVEKLTNAQLVLAVIERSDTYAELPWKAFALGAVVAGLGAALLDPLLPWGHSSNAVLSAVVSMLATGAACALLCVTLPGFARFYLDANRAAVEVRQHIERPVPDRPRDRQRGDPVRVHAQIGDGTAQGA